jgi:hypothetical protein
MSGLRSLVVQFWTTAGGGDHRVDMLAYLEEMADITHVPDFVVYGGDGVYLSRALEELEDSDKFPRGVPFQLGR